MINVLKRYFQPVSVLWIPFFFVFFSLLATPAQAQNSVFVLCYHTFIGKKTIDTDFSITEFAAHIQTLQDKGMRVVSLSDIHRGAVTGTRNVLLMFDDGNITAYHAYEQVLKPKRLPAVFAIYPGIIGRASYAMNWDQVRHVQKEGNDVVSHGFFHMYLTDKFAAEKPKEFEDEFRRSRHTLEKELAVSVNVFVYPFGIVSQTGKTQLKKDQYRYAYGLTQKPLQIPLIKNPDPLDLPRYMMTRGNAHEVLRQITR